MPGMKATMDEWKAGTLRSGSKQGPVVKSRNQAIAIGLSEQRAAKRSDSKGSFAYQAVSKLMKKGKML